MKNGLAVSEEMPFEEKIDKNLFLALAAILCNAAESLEQFWKKTIQGTFLWNLVKIRYAA